MTGAMTAKSTRPSADGPPILAMGAVTKTYQMGEVEVHALREVDFALHGGEFLVLLGPSGSGKSTLLNILGGLDVPTSGTVHFGHELLSDLDRNGLTTFRREHVGFVFQFYNLIPSLTARENVALVADIAPDPMAPLEALALVGLADRADHFPAQMSGGEQQRVAIARAVAKRPEILLCDEPTGALDIKTGKLVLEALRQVQRDMGAAVAVITHNAAIARMADRVVVLGDGRVTREERNAAPVSPQEIEW